MWRDRHLRSSDSLVLNQRHMTDNFRLTWSLSERVPGGVPRLLNEALCLCFSPISESRRVCRSPASSSSSTTAACSTSPPRTSWRSSPSPWAPAQVCTHLPPVTTATHLSPRPSTARASPIAIVPRRRSASDQTDAVKQTLKPHTGAYHSLHLILLKMDRLVEPLIGQMISTDSYSHLL